MTYSWMSKGLNDFSREFYEFTMPAVDMFEDDNTNESIVKIDLPGYVKKDIRSSIVEDILRIRANRERDEELLMGSVYYKHRPRQVDKKIISPISPPNSQEIVGAATYVDGVITVRIPIAQPRNIQIM
jgi:HSP20 family protein